MKTPSVVLRRVIAISAGESRLPRRAGKYSIFKYLSAGALRRGDLEIDEACLPRI
jgi:hypothetical protein